jgi:hypothetical protein
MRFGALWRGLSGILLASTLVGCGPSQPPMATVTGVVTMSGKPVEGAGVLIEPEAGGPPATATTDASGKFSVSSLIGPSKVAISKVKSQRGEIGSLKGDEEGVVLSGDTMTGKTEFITPPKYASPMTSGLTIDVQKGMDEVTFDLK